MVSFTSILTGAAISTVVIAQAPNASFPHADVQSILDDTTVSQGTRDSWCNGQLTSCGKLCGGQTSVPSHCDSRTLNYTCLCSSNSSAPALEYYQDTIPWYECTNLNGKCVASHANDLAGQEACNVTYVCGNIDITNAKIAAATTSGAAASASQTGSPSSSSTASATKAAASSATSKAAAAALMIGEQYGLSILGAGLFAVMGLVF